jgi:murein tripeptide amidase MpaA
VAFVGAIHGGYEWNTANLAYAMIDYFERNPVAVPDAVTLHIVPVANPDGLARVAPGWTTGPIPTPAGVISDTFTGRFNGRDVDLNRNWDCNWQPTGVWRDQVVDAGLAAFSEPETVALRDFFLEQPVQAVVLWHSAAGTVLAGTCAPDGHAPSRDLAEVYATAAGYPLQLALGYEINGDASDWLTTQGIPSIAIELTDHSRIEWDRNLAGTLAVLNHYAEACAGGACGGSDR